MFVNRNFFQIARDLTPNCVYYYRRNSLTSFQLRFLSLAQRSGTHCQTSSATHRYRLTVSVASLKHSCLQT